MLHRLKSCLLIGFPLSLLGLTSPLGAQELCGSQNQTVCLEGSSRVSFVNNTVITPGSRIVLVLPGLDINSRYEVSGNVTVPYRFAEQGSVTDSQNGVWSDWEVIARDSRGLSAIGFTLEQNALDDGGLTIDINQIRLCQTIADGPGEVNITVLFFQNTNKAKNFKVTRKNQALTAFRACSTYAGDLPLLEDGDALYLVNPHNERVWVTLDGARTTLAAHAQMNVSPQFGGQALGFSCNLPLTAALLRDGTDLAATALTTTNAKDWLVPHLARDAANWENHWIFAGGGAVSLSWAQGDNNGGAQFPAGTSALAFTPDPDESAGWLRLHDNQGHNGYFQFAARNGLGKAWVGAERIDPSGDKGHRLLMLPHITRDQVNFWTGISLANAERDDASLVLRGYSQDGDLIGEENLDLPAYSNRLGVIGEQFFVGYDNIAWLEISSDTPIAGTALLGSRWGLGVAGILLPHQGQTQAGFPILRSDSETWSGVVIVNPNDTAVDVQFDRYFADGTLQGRETITLPAKGKVTELLPRGVAHGALTCDQPVIGYAFIGRTADGALSGYLAAAPLSPQEKP